MKTKVVWKGNLSFTGTSANGYTIPLDSEPEVGGNGKGFRPMELLAIGLAGCTAMDVISILRKKRQDVTAFEVQVETDRAKDYPKVFTHITVDYIVTGHNVQPAAVERSMESNAANSRLVGNFLPAIILPLSIMPLKLSAI